jgi:hypothetical protein
MIAYALDSRYLNGGIVFEIVAKLGDVYVQVP